MVDDQCCSAAADADDDGGSGAGFGGVGAGSVAADVSQARGKLRGNARALGLHSTGSVVHIGAGKCIAAVCTAIKRNNLERGAMSLSRARAAAARINP